MILFVGHSLNTMTGGAVRSVPLDWQGPVGSYAADLRVAAGVARQPGVLQASPAATAPLAGATHQGPEGLTATGAGAVLAVPSDYLSHFSTFRLLHGSLAPGGVVLDQQMAATLQAQIGDYVSLTPRRGARPLRLRVSGVALVSASDVLFAPGSPGGAGAGTAAGQRRRDGDGHLRLQHMHPRCRRSLPRTSARAPFRAPRAACSGRCMRNSTALLSGSPSHALTLADRARNRVERSLPGTGALRRQPPREAHHRRG